uniref:ATPase AAA-type core domain-containing protein n=1 Tax=Saccharum hybrid cultivar R570 TaxID=131158 RepID=A0A059PZY5_9POAL|nr:hypothetical protein SHCRBa_119_B13_F_90 [Saccharum hybrid cultivar R570]
MRERKLYTNSDYCDSFGSVGPDAHGTLWSSHRYLLHGPPGTGKTSLIVSIANALEFNIYDLELTTVVELRRYLAGTKDVASFGKPGGLERA